EVRVEEYAQLPGCTARTVHCRHRSRPATRGAVRMTAPAIPHVLWTRRTVLTAVATAIVGALLSAGGFFLVYELVEGPAIRLSRGMATNSSHPWLPFVGLACGLVLTGLASYAVLTVMRLRRALEIQKRTEQALRESELRLNRAQSIAKIGSWESIPESNCLRWSREALRIFGYEDGVADRPATEWEERIHPKDRAGTIAILEANKGKGVPFEM